MHRELQRALDASNFCKVQQLVLSIPTSIPPSSSPSDIARTLEHIRRTIDILIQALDFNLSFETSYHTRNRLLSTKIPQWSVEIQRSFSFDTRIMARLATFMQLLATSADGRNIVGRVGYVDDLAANWKDNQQCISTLNALVTFCSGHIDNVSRCMRRRAISTAVSILSNSELLSSNPTLLNQTIVLLGLCAICTPDNKREATSVVPALIGSLRTLKLSVDVKISLFTTLANIFDCWTKEHTGYEVPCPHEIVGLAVQHWTEHADHQQITSAAAWLLLSMSATPRFGDAVKGFAPDIQGLSKPWAHQLKTVQQLHRVASNFISDFPTKTISVPTEPQNRVYGTRHAVKKRRIACGSAPNMSRVEITDVHGSDSELERSPKNHVPFSRLRGRRSTCPRDKQEIQKALQRHAAKKPRNICSSTPHVPEEEVTVVHGTDSETESDSDDDVPLCSLRHRRTTVPSPEQEVQKTVRRSPRRRKLAQRRISAPPKTTKVDTSTDTESVVSLPLEEECSPKKRRNASKNLPARNASERNRRPSERAARAKGSRQWWIMTDPLATSSIASST